MTNILEGDVRDTTNEELHDMVLGFIKERAGDLEDDDHAVLEEAAQRLMDMG